MNKNIVKLGMKLKLDKMPAWAIVALSLIFIGSLCAIYIEAGHMAAAHKISSCSSCGK